MISAWTKLEPDKNCYRYYAIWFEADLFDPFRVCCEWGRVGAKKHQGRVLVFQSRERASLVIPRLMYSVTELTAEFTLAAT